MGYFEQPLLLMFLGAPGSGKSFFARAMADKINAVRINGDSMRLSIFGSREEIEKLYASGERSKLNSYVFGGLDYVAEQILLRGHDVVYDAHHNKRIDRQKLEEIALRYGAIPILVWIKTPFEVALKRGQTREESIDSRRLSEDKMRETMKRHLAMTDEPTPEEQVIIIDGQQPFEEQFANFNRQLSTFHAGRQAAVKEQ